jgi:hypothetical protein
VTSPLAGSVIVACVANLDTRLEDTMARSNNTKVAAKPKASETPDLLAGLLSELEAQGITPKVKWAPSRNYASLYVDGENIGYVFKQNRNGMRIEPAASKADLPKGTKGFKPGTRSERFALVAVVTDAAEAKVAAEVLKAADDKRQAARAPGRGRLDLRAGPSDGQLGEDDRQALRPPGRATPRRRSGRGWRRGRIVLVRFWRRAKTPTDARDRETPRLAGTSKDGSDGTRTRDLRRDRPAKGGISGNWGV